MCSLSPQDDDDDEAEKIEVEEQLGEEQMTCGE